MYLGKDDIRRFRHFLDGIYTALEICGVEYSPIIDYDFTPWLARKYVTSDTLGWCEIIKKYEKNNSIANFFQLYENISLNVRTELVMRKFWSSKKYTSLNVWRKKRQAVSLLTNELDDFSIAKQVGLSESQVYWLRRAKHV